jgi:molybdopterin synthase sulfur carrier subunit
MNVRLLYFAALASATGCDAERVQTTCGDAAALYDEIAARYGFAFARSRLRVAINGVFASWDQRLCEGDEVALLPPVSGG